MLIFNRSNNGMMSKMLMVMYYDRTCKRTYILWTSIIPITFKFPAWHFSITSKHSLRYFCNVSKVLNWISIGIVFCHYVLAGWFCSRAFVLTLVFTCIIGFTLIGRHLQASRCISRLLTREGASFHDWFWWACFNLAMPYKLILCMAIAGNVPFVKISASHSHVDTLYFKVNTKTSFHMRWPLQKIILYNQQIVFKPTSRIKGRDMGCHILLPQLLLSHLS